MKPNLNLCAVLSSAAVAVALLNACSPVTPSQGKYQSFAAEPALPGGLLNIFVVTVSKLDGETVNALEKEMPADTTKISLSADEAKAQFEEFKSTGQVTLQFEGTLPEKFQYAHPFEHTTNKKDLEDQAQFQLTNEPKQATDSKTWSLAVQDSTQDADAGKRARSHLTKISFYFRGNMKIILPDAPAPSPEPAVLPSTQPSPTPSLMPSTVPLPSPHP